jgi:hypothetical protein
LVEETRDKHMADHLSPSEIRGSAPRWVKVSAAAATVAIVVIVAMLLAGHGPGQHTPGDAASPVNSSASGDP